jgi:hypothetical protein
MADLLAIFPFKDLEILFVETSHEAVEGVSNRNRHQNEVDLGLDHRGVHPDGVASCGIRDCGIGAVRLRLNPGSNMHVFDVGILG